MSHAAWPEEINRALLLSEFDERFRRYRLSVPEAERALVDSLKRYGQMAPVVVCVYDGEFLLIDGFKRLAAARSIKGFDTLRARSIECDERSAKAALYNLNRVGRGVQEIEEAWIVQALIREDGLSQVEVAELLSHHKSWVCRRLALLERLCTAARDDLSLGLLSPTQARQLVRLPAGNQVDALAVARRESLNGDELRGVVDRWEDDQPIYNRRFLAFAMHYGFRPVACRPRRPQTKGKVERPFDYVEKSLLAGREFRSLEHLNEVTQWWLAERANIRTHATTGERPIDRHAEERSSPSRRTKSTK